jgi:hypothetical protein
MPMAPLVRLAAVLASACLLIGLSVFVFEQASEGSHAQVEKLEGELGSPGLSSRQEQVRERRHGAVREAIDDANDVLIAPFAGIVDSDDPWVKRLVPTILALLVFGVGLGMLANYLPKPAGTAGDWRAPHA